MNFGRPQPGHRGAPMRQRVSAIPNLLAKVQVSEKHHFFAGSWSEWCSDPARPVEQG